MWRKSYFHNARIEEGINSVLNQRIGIVDPKTLRINYTEQSMDWNGNWLFFGNHTALRDCFLWHSIMFKHFKLVPEYCRLRCYKVVVKVRNFMEAIQFHNLMLAGPLTEGNIVPIQGKVGMDTRFYSEGVFNGFIYADGLEDALEKYAYVRQAVSAYLSPDIPVIIKRTCTEFEREFGPTDSPYWQSMSQEDLDIQHHLEDIFHSELNMSIQPDWIKNKLIIRFARWANTVGDKTWAEYFGTDHLTMKAVTYQHLVKGDKNNDSSQD
jgi:hypothetical protein